TAEDDASTKPPRLSWTWISPRVRLAPRAADARRLNTRARRAVKLPPRASTPWRREGSGLRMFPSSQTRIGCVIPGAVALRIAGTCQPGVAHEVRPRGSVTVVTFTEYWPARKFRTHGPPIGTLQHSWRFEIRPGGRIVSGGSDGSLPPQAAD